MPLSASSTRITSPSRCAQVYVAPGLVPGYSCPGAPDRLPGPQQAAPSKARPGCGSCQESKAVVHSALHVTSMLVTLRVPLLTSWKACGLSVQDERMIEGPERRPSGGGAPSAPGEDPGLHPSTLTAAHHHPKASSRGSRALSWPRGH